MKKRRGYEGYESNEMCVTVLYSTVLKKVKRAQLEKLYWHASLIQDTCKYCMYCKLSYSLQMYVPIDRGQLRTFRSCCKPRLQQKTYPSEPRSTLPLVNIHNHATKMMRSSSTSSSAATHESNTALTKYASSIAASLTVDEMRELHRQALAEAEAKQTELRIVLASRYRDLVGSSEQVLDMRQCAQEMDMKLRNLPHRMNHLHTCIDRSLNFHTINDSSVVVPTAENSSKSPLDKLRRRLFHIPKVLFESMDRQDVLGATSAILDFFSLIQRLDPNNGTNTHFPLAWAVLNNKTLPEEYLRYCSQIENPETLKKDVVLQTQMKMTYLQLQIIPSRLIYMSKDILLKPSELVWKKSFRTKFSHIHNNSNNVGSVHAYPSACALATYDLLTLRLDHLKNENDRGSRLIDLYLTSKATLIQQLLNQFSFSSSSNTSTEGASSTDIDDMGLANKAEDVLTLLVSVLQYDIILFTFYVFILRRFISDDIQHSQFIEHERFIMSILPRVDPEIVKNKVSLFLSVHLPLIRAKAKTVLASISTASRLGNIRQLLYDKTDGVDVLKSLTSSGLGSWEDAIQILVDSKVIFHALDGSNLSSFTNTLSSSSYSALGKETNLSRELIPTKKFSLWNCLFSHVFSSLVHSILTSSFQSVHSQVITSLRTSLACAPSYLVMLPHEAHRNMVRIAMELDTALKKLRDDAHELLVHAEEREESERRLKHSLYVQTCEIMGRLIHEIRRMLSNNHSLVRDLSYPGNDDNNDDIEEATKYLIVGRLCHVLCFRLTALKMLLDPTFSSAHGSLVTSSLGIIQGSGMISISELQSAFTIADDDDDGFISVDEAMDVMESAFSGTSFHGSRMVRETLLLDSSSMDESINLDKNRCAHRNVSLPELILLGARGLKLASSGEGSAFGTIQRSLGDIVNLCFMQWSKRAMKSSVALFRKNLQNFITTATTVSHEEWMRLHHIPMDVELSLVTTSLSISPHIVAFYLNVSTILIQSTCPTDSLPPNYSVDYATAIGIEKSPSSLTVTSLLRRSLLHVAFSSVCELLYSEIIPHISGSSSTVSLNEASPFAILQLQYDVDFIRYCFESNRFNYDSSSDVISSNKHRLDMVREALDHLHSVDARNKPVENWVEKHCHVLNSVDLFMSLITVRDSVSSTNTGFGDESLPSANIYLQPLSSSRRFNLLPVQADRSLSELQVLGKLERDQKSKSISRTLESIPAAANAVSSSLGFLSSMLQGKK